MNIHIRVIPHEQQRYNTAGDWFFVGEDLEIRVSEMSDWRFEMLLTEHELREAILCEQDGITQKTVDDFDQQFESTRPPGDTTEPGDSPGAPYGRQHFRATNSERALAVELGVDWQLYEAELGDLQASYPVKHYPDHGRLLQ